MSLVHTKYQIGSYNNTDMKHLKNNSDRLDMQSVSVGYVLVLYTGGTIGTVRNEDRIFVPKANVCVKKTPNYLHMNDKEYAAKLFGPRGPLALPVTATDKIRVVYTVMEYSPLCDSSNITMDDWKRIAKDIKVLAMCT